MKGFANHVGPRLDEKLDAGEQEYADHIARIERAKEAEAAAARARALPISEAQWQEWSWLTEIPLPEREHWLLAPPEMGYLEAAAWSHQAGYRQVLYLSSGETLVCPFTQADLLRRRAKPNRPPPRSPWAL
jgi:hypothetical protein